MFIISAILSIAPGHPAAVTAAARERLQASAARRHGLGLWAAEICEVNTLLSLFAGGASLDTLLAEVRQWLSEVHSSPAGSLLRYMRCEVHETQSSSTDVERLAFAPAMLIQVFRGGAASPASHAVQLEPISGEQGCSTVLTPLQNQDQAVVFARTALDDGADVADSGLWLPVFLPNPESNR